MCRGCFLLTKDDKPTTEEYLQCIDVYHNLIIKFRRLNTIVCKYKESLNGESRKFVDRFHKELIRVKRDLGKAESKLDLK